MSENVKVKFVIVGEAGVGKTSIMQMYSEGTFCASQVSTIGSTCTEKEVSLNDQTYCISIWDTAGQESYRTIVPMYFRGASVAIIVIDVTNEKTLETVDFWIKTIRENLGEQVTIVLCANKIDLIEERKIDDDSIQITSKNYKVPFFLTSAATGAGINNMFEFSLSKAVGDLVQKEPDEATIKENTKSGCYC